MLCLLGHASLDVGDSLYMMIFKKLNIEDNLGNLMQIQLVLSTQHWSIEKSKMEDENATHMNDRISISGF